jgi:hypothetical protein
MSDFIPKPGIKIGGLSRKAQKLQALREKAAASATPGAKPTATTAAPTFKAKSNIARKTTFQRKAV